ncbi:MAG: hypothetical protein QM820_49780 [Minicystis sp.]
MRLLSGSGAGLAIAFAVAAVVAGACSKTPHFVPDQAGGSGGSGASTVSGTTSSGTGGSGSRACVNTGDCNAVDTACAHPVCEDGVCKVQHEPPGTPTQLQIPHDCRQNVCDGAGNVTVADDPTDLPFDGNPCTDDTCDGGMPVHTLLPAGQACGQKTGMACDDTGHCTGCKTASNCGTTLPCFTWNCDTNDTCQQAFVPAGMGDPAGGTPGDCKRNVCDGMGGVMTVPDATDVPANPSACTLGACTGSAPTTKPAPASATCLGGTCDGMGNCGSCVTDSDCGDPSACATPKCLGGHCSAVFMPAGTVIAQQTPGDCVKKVCDSMGAVTAVPDDGDVPPDPDKCTVASCGDGLVVLTPVNVPSSNNPCIADGCNPQTGVFHDAVPNGTGCGGCSTCQGGFCVDPCPAMGCSCAGTSCDCGSGG